MRLLPKISAYVNDEGQFLARGDFAGDELRRDLGDAKSARIFVKNLNNAPGEALGHLQQQIGGELLRFGRDRCVDGASVLAKAVDGYLQ